MNDSEKKKFLTDLSNKSGSDLVQTLEFFRTDGDAELLPSVLDVLLRNPEQVVSDTIIDIVSYLKDDTAAGVLFDFVYGLAEGKLKKDLLVSLWQTGCDFSNNAGRVVEMLFAADDFETAFEVLTLLENSVENVGQDVAYDFFNRIKGLEMMSNPDFFGIYSAAKEHFLMLAKGREDY